MSNKSTFKKSVHGTPKKVKPSEPRSADVISRECAELEQQLGAARLREEFAKQQQYQYIQRIQGLVQEHQARTNLDAEAKTSNEPAKTSTKQPSSGGTDVTTN